MDKYIGKLLDNRYEILEIIGTGGMAVVYKAHCRLLNRYVAVKILKDEYAKDADFRKRFHSESQAIAKFSHQNIVAIYDVNRSDNIEYIVMELVEGVTLKEYMSQNGKLTTSEFLHFAPQIAAALEHAHSKGIIHRDVKPQNIIILPDGSLKVTDFGIARVSKSQQTLTDEALGSVHYVSPEQAKGSNIDERSDIYSFGVVMYEMLTGCLPFEGDSPVAVVLQHINSIPLQPREVDPAIPQALEEITMKAMNPSITKRYSSCREILEDFEDYKNDPDVAFGYVQPIEENLTSVSGDTMKFDKNAIKNGEAAQKESHSERKKSVPPEKKKKVRHYEDEDDYYYYYRRRTPVIAYLIAGILVSAIFFGGAMFIMTTIFSTASNTASDDVQVPTLVGKKLEEILSNQQYAEYRIVESESMYNDTWEEGVIIDQEPSAGRMIKADTEIYVTVSLGSKTMTLPDLTNYEYRYAHLQLSNMDLLYKLNYELSEDVAEGNVIRTEPAALSDVKSGDLIMLYVSLGKEYVSTLVPDLFGATESEAQRLLEKNNLVLGEVIPVESADAEDGTVVRQSIDPRTEVDEKTPVDIYICDNSVNADVPDVPDPSGDSQNSSPKGTYDLKIKLPSSPNKFKVTLKAGGDIIYEGEHEASEEVLIIPLKGTGSILARVFFDDKLSGEQVVVFD